jgi:hypothetical protein
MGCTNVLVKGCTNVLVKGCTNVLVKDCFKCFQIIIQIIIKKPNRKQFLCMLFQKTERKKNEPNKKKI